MKKEIITKIIILLIGLIILDKPLIVNGQNQKPVAAVIGIDSKGVIQDAEAVGYMVRLELEKVNVYTMMDKYDIEELIKKNNIDTRPVNLSMA